MTLQEFNIKAKQKFSDQSYGYGRQRIEKTVTTYHYDKFMLVVSKHDKDTKIEYFRNIEPISLHNFTYYLELI